jgi:hypothetical protein
MRAKVDVLLIFCVPALPHPGPDGATSAQESSKGREAGQDPGPARTLGKIHKIGYCALISLFVYHSPCGYIHDSAWRANHGERQARFFG